MANYLLLVHLMYERMLLYISVALFIYNCIPFLKINWLMVYKVTYMQASNSSKQFGT